MDEHAPDARSVSKSLHLCYVEEELIDGAGCGASALALNCHRTGVSVPE